MPILHHGGLKHSTRRCGTCDRQPQHGVFGVVLQCPQILVHLRSACAVGLRLVGLDGRLMCRRWCGLGRTHRWIRLWSNRRIVCYGCGRQGCGTTQLTRRHTYVTQNIIAVYRRPTPGLREIMQTHSLAHRQITHIKCNPATGAVHLTVIEPIISRLAPRQLDSRRSGGLTHQQ